MIATDASFPVSGARLSLRGDDLGRFAGGVGLSQNTPCKPDHRSAHFSGDGARFPLHPRDPEIPFRQDLGLSRKPGSPFRRL